MTTTTKARSGPNRPLTVGEDLSLTHIENMGLGLIRAIEAAMPEKHERDVAIDRVKEAVVWSIKGLRT